MLIYYDSLLPKAKRNLSIGAHCINDRPSNTFTWYDDFSLDIFKVFLVAVNGSKTAQT